MGVFIASKLIAQKNNLNIKEIDELILASCVHDLGKLCTPKEILNKNGKLTNEEFEIMKEHVNHTRDILEDANIEEKVINIACRHHEKLNGCGYPKKIDCRDLSIQDRILSVSDIFCALSEKRYYKECMPKEQVIDIFDKMVNNRELDHHIVNIVKENYEDLLENVSLVMEMYNELFDYIKKEAGILINTLEKATKKLI